MTRVMSNDDWKAQSDASTLAEAEAIRADKARLAKAASAAKQMAADQAEKLRGLQKVAGQPSKTVASVPAKLPTAFWRKP